LPDAHISQCTEKGRGMEGGEKKREMCGNKCQSKTRGTYKPSVPFPITFVSDR